jgi:hypothetical protein
MGGLHERNGVSCPKGAVGRLRLGPEWLRASLRRHPCNRELRLAYLARRPPQLVEADARLVGRRLALARAVKVLLGFAGFGILGGLASWAGVALTGQAVHGRVGLAIVLATGGALLGAVSFLALAVIGPVPLEDLFVPYQDPDKPRHVAPPSALLRFLRGAGALLIDLIGAALWGAVCGLGVGILGGLACAVVGAPVAEGPGLCAAGMVGGVLLGAVLAGVVVARRNANPLLPAWVDLGPIPWRAYFLGVDAAWKRFLGK